MTDPTLYFSPQPTRSARTRWAFLEAGIPFESKVIDVFKGEQKTPEYLQLNPLGQVPTATFDGTPVIESAALALIACSTGSTPGLLPAQGTAAWRRALQWTVFAPAELDHLLATLNAHRLFRPPPQRNAELVAETLKAWNARAQVVSDALANKRYLLGDEFSCADICVGHSVTWAKVHDLLAESSTLHTYLDRLQERPAFREVYGPEIKVFPDPHA